VIPLPLLAAEYANPSVVPAVRPNRPPRLGPCDTHTVTPSARMRGRPTAGETDGGARGEQLSSLVDLCRMPLTVLSEVSERSYTARCHVCHRASDRTASSSSP
jgi:hypothetical protein